MVTRNLVSTFSIVGCDARTGELGVAVQSKFLAVGAVVPWAKAGVGAVATQALANPAYGPGGIDLLAGGAAPQQVVDTLTAADNDRDHRQLGVVDAHGNSAAYTGARCFDWAGAVAGEGYAAQGNILVGEETVAGMARAFERTAGSLADRLVAALYAGQDAGGDSRGRQSAAILVVSEGGGYGGLSDRALDLRVDDHPDPIDELDRLRRLHAVYFGGSAPGEAIPVEGRVRAQLRDALTRRGYLGEEEPDEEDLHEALVSFMRRENLEEREREPGYVDPTVLEFIEEA